MTIQMFNPDNGKTADVHDDEVGNWNKVGWRLLQEAKEQEGDADLDELRKHAERVGIAVDKRWGPKRLREEMAKKV